MKVYTLFFTDESVPRFLGIDHTPREGEAVLTAEAKPSQIGIINKAARYKRDMDVDYIPPSHPGAPATVRVRTRPPQVQPLQSMGTMYHFPDGSRMFRHLDGTMEPMVPLDEEAW